MPRLEQTANKLRQLKAAGRAFSPGRSPDRVRRSRSGDVVKPEKEVVNGGLSTGTEKQQHRGRAAAATIPGKSRVSISPSPPPPPPEEHTENGMNFDPSLKPVSQVYGPTANIYTDVLNVPQDATSSEIREAFFCLRYDIYQKLSDQNSGSPGRGPSQSSMTSEERKDIEVKMNAITAAFQLLSDGERRQAYDSYLAGGVATSMTTGNDIITNGTDKEGFPLLNPMDGAQKKNPSSPAKLAPSKKDGSRTSLPIGQKRSVFRRRQISASNNEDATSRTSSVESKTSIAGGINDSSPRIKAATVEGRMNVRPFLSATTVSDEFPQNKTGRKESFLRSLKTKQGQSPALESSGNGLNPDDGELPAGVDNMNAREQMLYKNMRLAQQKAETETSPERGRLSTRYDNEERDDKFSAEALSSPMGVDEVYDNKWSRVKPDGSMQTKPSKKSEELAVDEDDGSRASSMYDDDTRTYDDGTYADDTTLGETIDDTTVGDSTWASYEDDTLADDDEKSSRFSPKHNKGLNPAPILRSGKDRRNSSGKDTRRVTIHSHRGKGEETEEDLNSLFDSAVCPTIPSLSMINDEISGTYKDFKVAMHQVSNAFTISPDDIDRMSDKIRDAKVSKSKHASTQAM